MPPTLILGCGYLGGRVARLLAARGDDGPVYASTRGAERADALRGLGRVEPVIADVTRPETLANLPAVDRVLWCVGFDRRAGHPIREVYVDGFRNVLDALARRRPGIAIVHVSSTGVYGGDDGGWVDEATPAEPVTESGRACLDAERLLVDRHEGGSIILRCAGLYGPTRIMRREGLIRGEPVVGSPGKFLNFIHIDDAAAVAVRALDEVGPQGSDLLLVSDGHPVTRAEFYGVACEYLGAPPPRFQAPAPGTPEARREGSNKRIGHRKLIDRWGDILQYPDIRAGLAATIRAEGSPRAFSE